MKKIFFTTLLIFVSVGQAFSTEPITRLITSDLAPYVIKNGTQPGVFIEVMQEVGKRLNQTYVVDFYPWTRAQHIATRKEGVIIFPMTRTPERENLYQWLYPVAPVELVFVSHSNKKMDLETAKKLGRIIVQSSTPAESFLRAHGFNNLVTTPKAADRNIVLLQRERVDAWFTGKGFAQYMIAQNKVHNLHISDPVFRSDLYVAASKSMPVEQVAVVRNVLKELVQDGTVESILQKYR
ncbi:MAG: ABC transporter substrate-binding protein [Methylocystaceae bacterium]|nr:ABC transporter substrate-binding protein [Methylocystaceae bacterium]